MKQFLIGALLYALLIVGWVYLHENYPQAEKDLGKFCIGYVIAALSIWAGKK